MRRSDRMRALPLMAILTLGVSFRRAPIELLEQLAFTDDDFVKAYRRAEDTEGLEPGDAAVAQRRGAWQPHLCDGRLSRHA